MTIIFLTNVAMTLVYMYIVYNWGSGITPKTPSGGHASLDTTQQSYRLTLNQDTFTKLRTK